MTHRQIGDLFGDLSYSTVSKVNERFSEKMKNNRTLKRTVDRSLMSTG